MVSKLKAKSEVLRCRNGDFKVFDGPDLISDALRTYGEWAQLEIELISWFLDPGNTVLDVGAYIGTHSRAFSDRVGQFGNVYSFEPNPKSFALLEKNAKLAHLANIRTVKCAVGARSGLGQLMQQDHQNFGATSVSYDTISGHSMKGRINVKTIDSLNLGELNFIKLDVEGSERAVLQGAQKSIAKFRPIISCELNSVEDGSGVFLAFDNLEYECFCFSRPAFNPLNFRKSLKQIFYENAREHGMLFIPRENTEKLAIARERNCIVPLRHIKDLRLVIEGKNEKLNQSTQHFIEKCQCSGLYLEIEGWFYSSQFVTISANLTIECTRSPQFAPFKIGNERRDVYISRGEAMGLNSGFQIRLKLDPSCGTPRNAIFSFKLAGQNESINIRATIERKSVAVSEIASTLPRILDGDLKFPNFSYIREKGLNAYWLRLQSAIMQPRFIDWGLSGSTAELGKLLPLIRPLPFATLHLKEPVCIIIPIYNGLEFLGPLFQSIIENTDKRHTVILVNDGNSDEQVRNEIREFARNWKNSKLLRLEHNQGFVRAINRGAELAQGHMILLNTDVVVPPNWVERLVSPISDDPAVASVTPISNAATICSFPYFCVDNSLFGGFKTEQIDRWFSHVDVARIDTEMPTGVGFCMAINKNVWDRIGAFDEEAFRRGYGEENDWCQRAIELGFKNINAPNVFAYHKHGGTFESSTRATLRQTNLNEVVRRYPSYLKQVDAYIRRDPLREIRNFLAVLVAFREYSDDTHLIIDHNLGGGANQFRSKMVAQLAGNGHPVLTLIIGQARGLHNEYRLDFTFQGFSAVFNANSMDELEELFEWLRPKEILLNNLVGHSDPLAFVRLIKTFVASSSTRLIVPIHDFYALCPSYTLMSNESKYCGLPNMKACNACLPINPFARNPSLAQIKEWRESWQDLLSIAHEIVCFSRDSEQKLLKIFPTAARQIVVRPHTLNVTFERKPKLSKSGQLKIGVVGAIGPQKGSAVVRQLAHEIEKQPGTSITVIGTIDDAGNAKNLKVTGSYLQSELPDLLEKTGVSICFFPSIWPETFSYVVEELMALDVPIAAFNIGAPAERIGKYRYGKLLEVELADQPSKLLRQLSDFGIDVSLSRNT